MEPEECIEKTCYLISLGWIAVLPADRDEMLMLKKVLEEPVDNSRLQAR